MKKASVRDLRYDFTKIERLLRPGEEVQVTKRGQVIARLVPEGGGVPAKVPDFPGRLRAIYGRKQLALSGAKLIAKDRDRY